MPFRKSATLDRKVATVDTDYPYVMTSKKVGELEMMEKLGESPKGPQGLVTNDEDSSLLQRGL